MSASLDRRRTEAIVAENAQEALRLRLRRMTSATVCKRMLMAKHPEMTEDVVNGKAEGVASALRSALGYWDGTSPALNLKILSQYYFALQLSIAEEVASADPTSTLESIQKHTEQGHGLSTIKPAELSFPDHYYIAALKSGHFSAYCKSRSLDMTAIAFDARPRNWSKVKDEDKNRFVTLADLMRRIPELRPALRECLGVRPLSFHLVHSGKNMEFRAARHSRLIMEGKSPFVEPEEPSDEITTTYLNFADSFDGGSNLTPEYIKSMGFPVENVVLDHDVMSGREQIVCEYKHLATQQWWESLPLYHSNVGTSLIAPLWGTVSDVFIIHFMTLYALSIVVRYLPSVWYEIEHGSLDNFRALLENYVTIADTVLPKCGVERISGVDLRMVYPGSMSSPI